MFFELWFVVPGCWFLLRQACCNQLQSAAEDEAKYRPEMKQGCPKWTGQLPYLLTLNLSTRTGWSEADWLHCVRGAETLHAIGPVWSCDLLWGLRPGLNSCSICEQQIITKVKVGRICAIKWLPEWSLGSLSYSGVSDKVHRQRKMILSTGITLHVALLPRE